MKAKIKINKLKKALQLVKDGKFVHVTCFNSIGYFFKFGKSKLAWKYTHFLIENSYQLFLSRQSLSVDNLVPYSKKCEIYESVLECLEIENQQISENELQKKLQLALDEIRYFYPCDGYNIGFRRIYIRAARRKIFDIDLMLLESCIRMLQRKEHFSIYSLIQMTKYFCIDYENLRFKLNEKSIFRFEKVIEFFEKQNTQ